MDTGQLFASKMMEFGVANARSVFEFGAELAKAKTPADLADAIVDHARQQFESLTEQFDELWALARKTSSEDDEPETPALGD